MGGDSVSRRWRRDTADEDDDVEDENGRFGLEKAEREGLKQKAIAIVVDLRSLSFSACLLRARCGRFFLGRERALFVCTLEI